MQMTLLLTWSSPTHPTSPRVSEETLIGEAWAAEVVTSTPQTAVGSPVTVRRLSSPQDDERRRKLLEVLRLQDVPQADAKQLYTFLANNHDMFSLEDGERGETSLVTMEIDAGDARPQKQPPRWMPFMVREEIA